MAKKKVFQISDALTEGLEETISAAHNYSGELRVEVIPIKKIEVDPENPRDLALTFEDLYSGLLETDTLFARKKDELESLQSIANSIRDQGIINPVVVYKYGDKYRLVAGERRTLASILAGKSEIQAKILDSKPNELKISLLQWVENVERSDLSLWERLRNLEKIVGLFAIKRGITPDRVSITDLSHLIGCTKPHAMNYKAVLLAKHDIKELIRENKIRSLEKAALIASIESPEIKTQAINACLEGVSLKKLRQIAEHETRKPTQRVSAPRPTRGRQAVSVNFGATRNLEVAKLVLDSILKNSSLNHVADFFTDIDWSDYKSVTNTFKQLLTKLEELHA